MEIAEVRAFEAAMRVLMKDSSERSGESWNAMNGLSVTHLRRSAEKVNPACSGICLSACGPVQTKSRDFGSKVTWESLPFMGIGSTRAVHDCQETPMENRVFFFAIIYESEILKQKAWKMKKAALPSAAFFAVPRVV